MQIPPAVAADIVAAGRGSAQAVMFHIMATIAGKSSSSTVDVTAHPLTVSLVVADAVAPG
jgi:hypothetical protein